MRGQTKRQLYDVAPSHSSLTISLINKIERVKNKQTS